MMGENIFAKKSILNLDFNVVGRFTTMMLLRNAGVQSLYGLQAAHKAAALQLNSYWDVKSDYSVIDYMVNFKKARDRFKVLNFPVQG